MEHKEYNFSDDERAFLDPIFQQQALLEARLSGMIQMILVQQKILGRCEVKPDKSGVVVVGEA